MILKFFKSVFAKNFINLSLNQVVNLVSGLVITPILFKTLGDENFGLVSLAFSIFIVLSIFVAYGYNLNGPVVVASIKSKKKLNQFVEEILSLRIFLSIIIILASSIVSYFFFENILFKTLIFSSLILIVEAINPFFLLLGKNKILPYAALNFFSKASYLIFIIIIINDQNDAFLVNFLYALSFIFFYGLYWIKNLKISLNKIPFNSILLNLKKNLKFFLSSVSSHFTSNSSMIILALFVTKEELGQFALAYKIAFLMRTLPDFFIKSILQEATNAIEKSLKNFKIIINKFYRLGLILTLSAGLIVFIISNQIIYILVDNPIKYSVDILKILAFIPFFAMLNFKNMVYLLVKNKKEILNTSAFYSLLFFLISAIVLSYFYGGKGLSVSLIFTEIFIYIIYSYVTKLNEK